MEEDNVAIRLKGFIQALGVTNSQFADKCGIPRPSLTQLLGGRNKKISDVIVGRIHQAYPELSVLWLLFGEGSMMGEFVSGDSSGIPLKSAMTEDRKGNMQDGDEIGQDGIIRSNLFDDNDENLYGRVVNENYENVRGLNQSNNERKSTVKQKDDKEFKIAELTHQIDKMRKNPRKVSHITIYYDDSTFETFYPRR